MEFYFSIVSGFSLDRLWMLFFHLAVKEFALYTVNLYTI